MKKSLFFEKQSLYLQFQIAYGFFGVKSEVEDILGYNNE